MTLILHITLAIVSLIFTPVVYMYPSKAKLIVGYILTAFAFASGVYLVWGKPVDLVKTCIIGLVYLSLIFFGLNAARIKLARLAKEPLEKIQ
jgi:hypothetical protein